jgi:hypothetical protein
MAWAPLAQGVANPVAEGRTKLQLSASLYAQLRASDIRLVKLKAGKAKGRTVTLPVGGGELDPGEARAVVNYEGGFKLIAGRHIAKVQKLSLDTAENELRGKIGGQGLRIASLEGVDGERNGFGVEIAIAGLKLTPKAATALNRALGLQGVFRGGRSLGTLSTVVQPATVAIAFGKIAIGGPDTAFSKLESLGVQMGIWGASERWSAPGETYFLFEVAPTTVAADASTGILEASGNDGTTMEIHAAPPRNMLLRGPRIDLASRELSATISPLSAENPVTAAIASLDYGDVKFQIRPDVGAFELMGIRAAANQFIADRLNERFATPGLFQAGETLARMTLTLHAQ